MRVYVRILSIVPCRAYHQHTGGFYGVLQRLAVAASPPTAVGNSSAIIRGVLQGKHSIGCSAPTRTKGLKWHYSHVPVYSRHTLSIVRQGTNSTCYVSTVDVIQLAIALAIVRIKDRIVVVMKVPAMYVINISIAIIVNSRLSI